MQSDEGRGEPQMVVYVGDRQARRFTNRTVPFPLEDRDSGMWNSLFAKNADTVTAVSGTKIKGTRGIWTIDGTLKRPGRGGTTPLPDHGNSPNAAPRRRKTSGF